MDPTVPNNDNPKDQNSPQKSPSLIQPGQFVVAGEDDVFKQPPQPSPNPPPPNPPVFDREVLDSEVFDRETQTESAQTRRADGSQTPQPEPQLQAQTVSSSPPPESITGQSTSPSAPGAGQPNPTPYVPPPAAPSSQPAQPSIISKLRKILIILIVLAVVGIVAAAVWFLVLGKSKVAQKQTIQEEETGQETPPTPLPKRVSGGFADLPVATDQSQATSSAEQADEEEQ